MAAPQPPGSGRAPGPGRVGRRGIHGSREFMNWAAGTGRVLAELTTQLTRAKISRNQRRGQERASWSEIILSGLPLEDMDVAIADWGIR